MHLSIGRGLPFVAASCLLVAACRNSDSPLAPLSSRVVPVTPNAVWAPVLNPANFTAGATNPYFPLMVGKTYRYQGETEDGTELGEAVITNQAKTILNLAAVVVRDRVYLDANENGVADGASCGAPGFTAELIEETLDWYATDNGGTVWYLGEDSKEYDECTLVGTTGSWEAGVGGAQPGIIMLADPVVGQSYRQELAAGVAEDWARVMKLDVAASVPYGDFDQCIETMEWTPLEPGHRARKVYCSGVGLVRELTPKGGRFANELVSVSP